MLNPALVIARKEIMDGLRDVRSVISALLYALMGPFVVGMVSISIANRASAKPETTVAVLVGMAAVFTLVAAFVGGMNVAMDTIAGERERRSLLPLLLNPVPRLDIAIGKWLAVSFFSIAGLAFNLLGFAVVLAAAGIPMTGDWPRSLLVLVLGIFPLTLFAAAVQLWISTVCRGIKEAQTYLSMLVFLPMGLGMFLVFFPRAAQGWLALVPVAGQHLQLEVLMRGGPVQGLQPILLGCFTAILAIVILRVVANRLRRDEIIYGN